MDDFPIDLADASATYERHPRRPEPKNHFVDGFLHGRNWKMLPDGSYERLVDVLRSVELLLWCPQCGERHIEKDGAEPHHTHACHRCGMVWRPASVLTHGVHHLTLFK